MDPFLCGSSSRHRSSAVCVCYGFHFWWRNRGIKCLPQGFWEIFPDPSIRNPHWWQPSEESGKDHECDLSSRNTNWCIPMAGVPHQVLQCHKWNREANMLPDIWHHGYRRHHLVLMFSALCVGFYNLRKGYGWFSEHTSLFLKYHSHFRCSLNSFVQKDISCEGVRISFCSICPGWPLELQNKATLCVEGTNFHFFYQFL